MSDGPPSQACFPALDVNDAARSLGELSFDQWAKRGPAGYVADVIAGRTLFSTLTPWPNPAQLRWNWRAATAAAASHRYVIE